MSEHERPPLSAAASGSAHASLLDTCLLDDARRDSDADLGRVTPCVADTWCEADSLLGRTIAGRYRLEQHLGSGGMGHVFRARQLGLERPVALKLMPPTGLHNRELRAHFEREARVASRLRHPDAVQVYDYGADEHGLYLAMELVHGMTLRAALIQLDGPLPPRRAVRIGARVADVLVAAHDLGLVHRDLKPDNIMLEPAPGGLERVRVMDFGLAFIDGGEPGLGHVTLGKLVSGTPEYMAPEQVHGAKVSVEADLYALGCVLHEVLVGLPPLHDSSLAALLAKHLFMLPPRLREVDPRLDVPSVLEECVSALLAKDPGDRPSARRVRDLLTHLDLTASERLSPAGQAGGRAARMISEPPPSALPKLPRDRGRELGVVGALPDEVALGLASQGFRVCELSEPAQAADVPLVLLCEPEPERVRAWVGQGRAVVAILSAPSFESLNEHLRLGVDEIVVPPLTAADLGARLARALRKQARKPRP